MRQIVAPERVIADALGIDASLVTDALEYQAIPRWDSLGHVSLMVALEQAYDVTIDDELTVALRSVPAIREFVETSRAPVVATPAPPASAVHRGLEDVVFDQTTISRIDGGRGILEYRGYGIHELAERASYEEVACLLVDGELPDEAAVDEFRAALAERRALPVGVLQLIESLVDAHPVDVLRTCVSALGALGLAPPVGTDETYEQARAAGITLIAQVPMIVATHHALRSGRAPMTPPEDASYVETFLAVLLGDEVSGAAARAVNRSFIVHAEHASNASAFVARIAVSCRAPMTSAVTAAIAAFAGSVHGGAAERAVRVIDEVGDPVDAEAYVAERWRRNEPVMGFGHRVYRTEDPRVRHLRATVVELSEERGDSRGLEILDAVAEAMAPYGRHGVAPNVDLYAGLALRLLGLPDDLSIPMFVISRTAGWVAQALEQHENNVLIRPLLQYVGPQSRVLPASHRPHPRLSAPSR